MSAPSSKEQFIIGERNPRGIPKAIYIGDINAFMTKNSFTGDGLIAEMNQLYQKYKYMERHLTDTKKQLKLKVPEIAKTLDMVKLLKKKTESGENVETYYSLADNIYTKASVDNTGTVCIWLGANVMVEYTYDEAIALLQQNYDTAAQRLKDTDEDLAFIRCQSITVEVNMARVYNYEVKERRKAELEKQE